MKTVNFLYGRTTFDLEVPDDTPVLTSNVDALKSDKDGYEIVKEAMDHPIDSPHLYELAKGKPDCTIIISDHTRPVPSQDILPHMIRELRCGNPDIKITLLVATGFHRPTTVEELKGKLGDALYEEFKDNIVVHDAHDPSKNIKVGNLPSGPDCIIDKVAYNASLLVAEGFIEALSSLVSPAVVRVSFLVSVMLLLLWVTIAVNLSPAHMLVQVSLTRTQSMKIWLQLQRWPNWHLSATLLLMKTRRQLLHFAGNFKTAHRKGVDFLSGYCAVKPAPADIVITTNGGYPLDQNAYQCPKGMSAAEATVNDGGVIIMLATCQDGHGGESYYHSIADAESADAFFQQCLHTPQVETLPDQWCAQIWCRIVRKYKVLFVADKAQEQLIRDLKVEYFETLDEAYARARELKGPDATLTCIPNGVSVVVKD